MPKTAKIFMNGAVDRVPLEVVGVLAFTLYGIGK